MTEADQPNDDAIAKTLRELLLSTRTNRSILWKLVDDHLEVACELVEESPPCFAGTKLSDQESSAVLLELLSRGLRDDFKCELISIDYEQDAGLTGGDARGRLPSLLKLGDVRASLVATLWRNRKMNGFLELQQTGSRRHWTQQNKDAVEEALPKLGFPL